MIGREFPADAMLCGICGRISTLPLRSALIERPQDVQRPSRHTLGQNGPHNSALRRMVSETTLAEFVVDVKFSDAFLRSGRR